VVVCGLRVPFGGGIHDSKFSQPRMTLNGGQVVERLSHSQDFKGEFGSSVHLDEVANSNLGGDADV
jgi:hypothetical protein